MVLAYIIVPFQQTAKVIGDRDEIPLQQFLDRSIPSDLPNDWHKSNIFPIYFGFHLKGGQYAFALTIRGPDDQYGRPNLLTRAIISDDPKFMIDPISSWKILQSGNTVSIDAILREPLSFAGSQDKFSVWKHTLPLQANIQNLADVIYSILAHKSTYVRYSKIEHFVELMRILYLVLGPSESSLISFESYTDSGIEGSSNSRIIGLRAHDYPSQNLSSLEKSVKKQKAFLVDLDSGFMAGSLSATPKHKRILGEIFGEPWYGMDKAQHLAFISWMIHKKDANPKSIRSIFDLGAAGGHLERLVTLYSRLEEFLKVLEK